MNSRALDKHADSASTELADAVRLHRGGDLEQARCIYQRIIEQEALNPDALHLLGVVAYQQKQFDEARDLICRAIGLAPDQAAYYSNLGNACRAKGHLPEAVRCYRKAVELNPDYAEAYFNLGIALSDQGEIDSAIQHIGKAASLDPEQVEAHIHLGRLFELSGMPDRAVSCYHSALEINADCVEACIRLGSAYQKTGDHAKAIPYFEKALAADPAGSYRLFNNLGISHQNAGNLHEAIRCFETAANLNPEYDTALYNLGVGYQLNGELEKSIQVLKQTIALNPNHAEAVNLVVHLLQRTCEWAQLERYVAKMADLTERALKTQRPTAEAVYTNVCTHPDPSLNLALARSRSRDIAVGTPDIGTQFVHHRTPDTAGQIVLGYFSGDFRNHPVAHLIRGVLNLHDRQAFKVGCYSYGRDDGSLYRSQIMQDCDHFVDLRGMTGREMACRIYADKVDILIDLMGHTAGNRLEVCAARPAPIQVTYLGFPGTTGADFIDYIITDKIVSPLEHEAFYSENLAYLPHCYQANDNAQKIAVDIQRRSDWGLPEDGFVFSSFNQPVKIEPILFNCWMKILQRVPESVIWLLEDNRIAADNLRQSAQNCGVNPARLIFAPKISKETHLARMALADLALDTRVYNGHTTTSDSLWAGVPVVTLIGNHFASRVSASILSAMGLTELITRNPKDYEDLAVQLASDSGRLRRLRHKLNVNRYTQPLFNTPRFTRKLEQAYKTMWQIFIDGEKPRRIEVAA